ncbi:MAG TPA: SDR family NAD(P)-dependent oxidoreductase [Polyangia bacterium]|nr:SDR family NAD(P)-dependent oxidoreductase [Polyangia bacterium]
MHEFRGKTAVVTGAASGIGRALAERFAKEGMQVVLADHDAPALERAAAELESAGAAVLAVPTDVSNGAAVAALAARAREKFGALHVVCNNAGIGGAGGPIWTLSENDWQWALSVNLWGVIHGIRAFVPLLLEHGGAAHVVNTASIAGLAAPAFMGPYVASKHAVVAISEVLARDLQAFGARVRVSVLCPGFVRTNIADTERHRPAHLRDARGEDPAQQSIRQGVEQAVRKLVSEGKPASEVADHVFTAIREDRFYVLPHSDLKGMVRDRLTDILDDRYPRFDPAQFIPERNR